MFKSLFISLNLVGLILLPFLYVGDVSVVHDLPSEIAEENSVEVTVTINKGSATGPARLALDFESAPGMSVEEVSNAGASFSFDESKALFVWYSIPEEETITLKYRLTADAGSIGSKTVSGSFSYLDGEERATETIDPITFTVTEGNGNSSVTTTNIENNESQSTSISGTRTIEQNGDDYIVTVAITKGDQAGFARLKESIPTEFTATKIDGAGGVYKYTNNTVKFLWTKIPSDKTNVTVSYRLTPVGNAPQEFTITGYFSGEFLIVDDKPKSIDIPATTFVSEMASNGNGENGNGENGNGENGNGESGNGENGNGENGNGENGNGENGNGENGNGENGNGENGNGENGNGENGNTTVETHSNPITGVSYRVQVLAAHKTVDAKYIKKRYNGYNKQLNLDNHEGWVKYTTDGVSTYKGARDTRNSVKKYDFPGPFVTAYNSGERITVQEALMLSSQEWVK